MVLLVQHPWFGGDSIMDLYGASMGRVKGCCFGGSNVELLMWPQKSSHKTNELRQQTEYRYDI